MVSVTIDDKSQQINGSIECILCKRANKKVEPMSVQKKIDENQKIYWILSIFGKHVAKDMSKLKKIKTEEHSSLMPPNIAGGESPIEEISVQTTDRFSTEEYVVLHHDDEFEIEDDSKYNFPVNLEIAPIENNSLSHDELQLFIYNQICDQIISINGIALKYGEEKVSMTFYIEEKEFTLQITEIEPDGNCLFGALVHQIFRTKNEEKHQANKIKKLREDVVAYINQHRDDFEHDLKGCVMCI